jgi:hypothetical protein
VPTGFFVTTRGSVVAVVARVAAIVVVVVADVELGRVVELAAAIVVTEVVEAGCCCCVAEPVVAMTADVWAVEGAAVVGSGVAGTAVGDEVVAGTAVVVAGSPFWHGDACAGSVVLVYGWRDGRLTLPPAA